MVGFVIPQDAEMKLTGRLPVGQFKCEVESVTDAGLSQAGNQKMTVKLVCKEGEHEDDIAFDNLVLVPKCFFRMLPYGIAANKIDENGDGDWAPGVEIDFDDILGVTVLVTLEDVPSQDGLKTYVNVTRVEPVG